MSEFGLFVGWGATRAGREAAAEKVFGEAVAYWNGLKDSGALEGVEVVILGAHAGDLGGFWLAQGTPEQLAQVSMAPEFRRLLMRAQACLDNVGAVQAYVDGGVMRVMGVWREAIADLV